MWEQGASSTSVDSTYRHDEVHVLLVHHDLAFIGFMSLLLKWCSYKVTTVESGYEALSILSKRNHSVDIILTGIHLRDLNAFELLQHTVNMDLPTILISANDGDTVLAAKAIENGALLFLVHPITKETLQYLRQHVMREKLMTSKNEKHILEGKRCVEEGNRILDNYSVNKRAANMFMEKGKSQVNEECDPKINSNFVVKRKASIEWTKELQAKFWETTNFLGEGRCYPREILEHMNVSGLTRLQVGSFLQRCRKKSNPPSSSASSSRDGRNRRVNTSKYGSMPLLIGKSSSNVQSSIQETQENHRATTTTRSLDDFLHYTGNEYVQNFSGLQQFNQNQRIVVDNEKLLQNKGKGKEKVEYTGKGIVKATTNADFVFIPTTRVPNLETFTSYTPPAVTLPNGASSSGLGFLHYTGNEYVQNLSGLEQFNQNQRTVVDNEKLLQNKGKGKEKVEYTGKATTNADFVFIPTPSVPTLEILRSYTPPAGTLQNGALYGGLGFQTPGMSSLCSQTSPSNMPSISPKEEGRTT